MKKKKYPQPIEEAVSSPKGFKNQKFLYCPTHDATFTEGERCPFCPRRRLITDDWAPSMDNELEQAEWVSTEGSLVSAMSAEKPPQSGVFKVIKCQLHGVPYVEGVNKCPFCEFGK